MKRNNLFLFTLMSLILSGCGNKNIPYCDELEDYGSICITFDTCTNLKTNTVKKQYMNEPGKVKKPNVFIIGENPDNLAVYGWYKDRAYTTEWNFKTDKASESMTLYAKFVSQYKVNYYQGFDENSMYHLASETVFKNELVPKREDLPDCYENPETVYVTDMTQNDDGSYKATKGSKVNFKRDKVTKNLSILMKRSENFYLSPGALSRRFSPVASCAGSNGSTLGKIDLINPGTDSEFARLDFGIVSDKDSVFDPYFVMDNPQIDVTNSQYIEIKMRNLGEGEALTFYWVGKWKVNGQWINGKEYHSFAEDRRFSFKKGDLSNTADTIYRDENGQDYKNKQNETDSWKTYLLPISNSISNGVSTWGCAGKITALRIQSTLPLSVKGKTNEEKKNVLDIKYIKGVKDVNHVYDFTDSDSITVLKTDDESTAIESAAGAQSSINGFVFPKNNDTIFVDSETSKANVYKKTDGIYISSKYEDGTQTVSFNAKTDIDVTSHTTFNFTYRNLSYMDKVTFTFRTIPTEGAKVKKVSTTYSMMKQMKDSQNAKINMFGTNNFKGKLEGIDVSFTPIGVDNMIKFSKFELSDYEAKSINGFNFNDLYCGGFTYDDGLTHEYDSVHKGTMITSNDPLKSLSKDIEHFNLNATEKMTLSYQKPNDGINKVIVKLTTSDVLGATSAEKVTTSYEIDAQTSSTTKTSTIELIKRGYLYNVQFMFEGTGTIYLKGLNWNYYKDCLDFTTGEYVSTNHHVADDIPNYRFDETELAIVTNTKESAINGRLGVRGKVSGLKQNGTTVNNFSLKGKTKIIAMYQNRGSSDTCNLCYGAILKSNYEGSEYLTAEGLTHAGVTIGGITVVPNANKASDVHDIQTNMSEGEWDVMEININPFFTTEENECYCSELYFATPTADDVSFYIRTIAAI